MQEVLRRGDRELSYELLEQLREQPKDGSEPRSATVATT